MESSDQIGYGNTEEYNLVAEVQYKKCDETLKNNLLLRINMQKHFRKEQDLFK
jgi:hypothetical protein